MTMMNDQDANSYSKINRVSRGGRSLGTGASDAATVNGGTVLEIGLSRTNAIILTCRPETSQTGIAHVEVTLLTPYAGNNGGAFSSPRVGDKITWLTAGGHSYYLGMSHQSQAQPPFTGPLPSGDEEKSQINTGGPSMLSTGFRLADQPDGTLSDDLVPVENAQVGGSPGTDPAKTPGADVLLDPATNTFRSPGEILGTDPPDDPCEIDDAVFEKCSPEFAAVMRPLNRVKDPAYATAKGFGFNEISIRNRTAKLADPSGGDPTASATDSESSAPPSPGAGSYDTILGQGGITHYGQDYVQTISNGDTWETSVCNQIKYAGERLELQAGHEIILRVGDSSITLNDQGIALAQRELGGIGSSMQLSHASISTYSVNNEINAWNYSVTVPWATLNLAPMNAVLAACQGVEIKSGFDNYAPFAENVAETVAQIAYLGSSLIQTLAGEGETGESSQRTETEIGLQLADALALASAGVPINAELMKTSYAHPLFVSPGLAAMEIVGPALGMVQSMFTEVMAARAGNLGSATIKLNNADMTLQSGYIEQIPPEMLKVMAIQASVTMVGGLVPGNIPIPGSIQEALAGGVAALGALVPLAIASTVGITEMPLKVSGSGNVRIEASNSMTSGAYISPAQIATATPGQTSLGTLVTLFSGGGLSLMGAMGWYSTKKFAKMATNPAFAGVSGVGLANSFLYHNFMTQTSSSTNRHLTVTDSATTISSMTEILLEGPTDNDEHHLGAHEEAPSENETAGGTRTRAKDKSTNVKNNDDGSTTTETTTKAGNVETTTKTETKTTKNIDGGTTTTKEVNTKKVTGGDEATAENTKTETTTTTHPTTGTTVTKTKEGQTETTTTTTKTSDGETVTTKTNNPADGKTVTTKDRYGQVTKTTKTTPTPDGGTRIDTTENGQLTTEYRDQDGNPVPAPPPASPPPAGPASAPTPNANADGAGGSSGDGDAEEKVDEEGYDGDIDNDSDEEEKDGEEGDDGDAPPPS